MAVTDAPRIEQVETRLKAAGPTAAAIGIITTIVGVSLLAKSPESPARPAATPAAMAPAPAPEGPLPPVIGLSLGGGMSINRRKVFSTHCAHSTVGISPLRAGLIGLRMMGVDAILSGLVVVQLRDLDSVNKTPGDRV